MTRAIKAWLLAREEADASIGQLLVLFALAACVRSVEESWTNNSHLTFERFVHYSLFYPAVALFLLLLLAGLSRRAVPQVARVLTPCMAVIVTPPLLDLTLFAGFETNIGYVVVTDLGDLLHKYVTFFGPVEELGITPGIRTEIALAMVGVFSYIWLHTERIARAALGAVATYSFIFALCVLPWFHDRLYDALFADVSGHGGYSFATDTIMLPALAVVIVVELLALAAALAPELAWAIFKDSRFLRVAHYELMMVIGLALGAPIPGRPSQEVIWQVALAFVAIWLAWVHAVMVNNVHDTEIDAISNSGRPLVASTVDPDAYRRASVVVGTAALLTAAAASFNTLLLIAIFMASYQVYSAPPLRTKRVLFFSKMSIAVNTAATFFIGLHLAGGNFRDLAPVTVLGLLLTYLTATQFIDLKDTAGDARAGIRTLPTVLGQRRAGALMAILFGLGHLGGAIALRSTWLALPLACAGLIYPFLFARARYVERPVMQLHVLLLTAVAAFCITSTHPLFSAAGFLSAQAQLR